MNDSGKNATNLNGKLLYRLLFFLLPAGIVGNVVFSVSMTDWNAVHTCFHSLHETCFLLALLLALLPWIFHCMRIRLWTDFTGTRLSVADSMYVVIGDELGSCLTPTSVGGGYVKFGLLLDNGIKPGVAASISTIGTLENASFFGIAIPLLLFSSAVNCLPHQCAVATSLFLPSNWETFLIISVIFIGTAFALVVWYRKKGMNTLLSTGYDFLHTYHSLYAHGKSRFALGVLLTALQWICRYSVVTALVASFGVAVHPLQYFFLQWIVFVLTIAVPTPGGSIGAEASFYLIFKTLIPEEIICLLIALWRFLTFHLQMIFGAVIFAALNARKMKCREDSVSMVPVKGFTD